MLEGEEQAGRGGRELDSATSLSALSLDRVLHPGKAEEGGVKLQLHKCDFCQIY